MDGLDMLGCLDCGVASSAMIKVCMGQRQHIPLDLKILRPLSFGDLVNILTYPSKMKIANFHSGRGLGSDSASTI